MNPKLMLPVGIAVFVIFAVFTVRNFTRDPYAEIQAEERQAKEQQAEQMRVKYRSSDAYLLTFFTLDARAAEIDPEGYHRSISDNLGDAILAEMLERVKPHGINRSYNSDHHSTLRHPRTGLFWRWERWERELHRPGPGTD